MRKIVVLAAFVFAFVAASNGCVSSAVKDQVSKSAAAADLHAKLISQTLNGTIAPADGAPVTTADLVATPKPVRALLENTIRAVYVHRKGWHQADFAVNGGPDPATLDLEPPKLP